MPQHSFVYNRMKSGGLNELALFAGAGGGILAGKSLGWRTVCAVERDAYAASVLLARQNEGLLSHFPIWDDVCTFDGKPWRGIIDVVSGGFPCQDISVAGKGKGIDGERSGLWGQMFRIICEVRPRFVFVENSPMLTGRGLGRVLGDLAAVGLDARWGVLGADDVGAPHKRERIWIVANTSGRRCSQQESREVEQSRGAEIVGASFIANAYSTRQLPGTEGRDETRDGACNSSQNVSDSDSAQGVEQKPQPGEHGRPDRLHDRAGGSVEWPDWQAEPDVGRVADGVAFRVDRIKCLGNGQVPKCAAEAWKLLTKTSESS